MNFSIIEPEENETPLVVEVPHAGLGADPLAMATLAAPVRALGVDADLYVDELYADAPQLGATLLVSHVSRYVVDLNRSETDYDALAARGGTAREAPHGLVWRTTTESTPALYAPLETAEVARRIRDIYRPYHGALTQLLRRKHDRFGFALLLCAHSMPSLGRRGHDDPGTIRADVVPGSRGRTTAAAALIDAPDALAQSFGWTVAHDVPYRGGFSTGNYGRPREGYHAVQVELARRLYMNEQTLVRLPGGFERTRQYCQDLVKRLAAIQP